MPVNVSALMVNRAVTFYTSGGPEHPKQDIHTFRKNRKGAIKQVTYSGYFIKTIATA